MVLVYKFYSRKNRTYKSGLVEIRTQDFHHANAFHCEDYWDIKLVFTSG